MNICIFLNSGRTYSFKNCKVLIDNETVISFSYTAMSDGKEKVVTFYKVNFAGVAMHKAE